MLPPAWTTNGKFNEDKFIDWLTTKQPTDKQPTNKQPTNKQTNQPTTNDMYKIDSLKQDRNNLVNEFCDTDSVARQELIRITLDANERLIQKEKARQIRGYQTNK